MPIPLVPSTTVTIANINIIIAKTSATMDNARLDLIICITASNVDTNPHITARKYAKTPPHINSTINPIMSFASPVIVNDIKYHTIRQKNNVITLRIMDATPHPLGRLSTFLFAFAVSHDMLRFVFTPLSVLCKLFNVVLQYGQTFEFSTLLPQFGHFIYLSL